METKNKYTMQLVTAGNGCISYITVIGSPPIINIHNWKNERKEVHTTNKANAQARMNEQAIVAQETICDNPKVCAVKTDKQATMGNKNRAESLDLILTLINKKISIERHEKTQIRLPWGS
jgi:hypothetical protein